MSQLSRMKNPDLPYPSVAAALRAYSDVLWMLDIKIHFRITPFLLSSFLLASLLNTSRLGMNLSHMSSQIITTIKPLNGILTI